MKAKKENTSRAFGFTFLVFVFFFGFCFFIKLINCAYFIHNRFLYILHLKQKYTVTVKDAVLSIKYLLYYCFLVNLFVRINDVLGIKLVYLGAKYDC